MAMSYKDLEEMYKKYKVFPTDKDTSKSDYSTNINSSTSTSKPTFPTNNDKDKIRKIYEKNNLEVPPNTNISKTDYSTNTDSSPIFPINNDKDKIRKIYEKNNLEVPQEYVIPQIERKPDTSFGNKALNVADAYINEALFGLPEFVGKGIENITGVRVNLTEQQKEDAAKSRKVGEIAGLFTGIGGAYGAATKAYKPLSKSVSKGIDNLTTKISKSTNNKIIDTPLNKPSKTLDVAVKGGTAGTMYQSAEETADVLWDYREDGEQTYGERLKNIGQEATLWAVADPLVERMMIPAIKTGFSKIKNADGVNKLIPKQLNETAIARYLTKGQTTKALPSKTSKTSTKTIEPFQMSNKEFNEQAILTRKEVPEITFKEYAKSKGYKLNQLADAKDYNKISNVSLTSKSKSYAKTFENSSKRVEKTNNLYDEYLKDISSGKVNKKVIDNDLATKYHKESIKSAIKIGEKIPKKAIENYPDLMKKYNKSIIKGTIPEEEAISFIGDKKERMSLSEIGERFYEQWVNKQYQISKQTSGEIEALASLTRQTKGTTDYIYNTGLVNKNGEKINSSLQELFEKVIPENQREFSRYIFHKSNIVRAREGKRIFSQFNSEASERVVKDIEKQFPDFAKRADKIYKWIDDLVDAWGKEIYGEKIIKYWGKVYPNYFPTFRSIDKTGKNLRQSGMLHPENAIKEARGAKNDLSSTLADPKESLLILTENLVSAGRKYDVLKEQVRYAKLGEFPGVFRIAKVKTDGIKAANDAAEKKLKEEGLVDSLAKFNENFETIYKNPDKKGFAKIEVNVNNEKVILEYLDKDYLRGMQALQDGNGKAAAELLERVFRRISQPIKDLITNKNPLFGIVNGLRDFSTAFIQGQETNLFKFVLNYMKAIKDILRNTKQFNEFIAQGGMQTGLYKHNNLQKLGEMLRKNEGSKLRRAINKVEYFNSIIETAPRYMEYSATLSKGGTRAKALFNAAEVTVNFSRKGEWGKFVDSFVLYFNPAVQGIDKLRRSIINKPLQTSLKSATIITAPTLILDYTNKDNPNYQNTNQRNKDMYFLIPNKYGELDSEGNPETFFKIPKARMYATLFGVLAERTAGIIRGEPLDTFTEGLGTAMKSDLSVPTRPVWAPMSDIEKNEDWKGQPIVPLGMELDNRSKYNMFDETTSEIGKYLGKLLDNQPIEDLKLAPKEIDYLIDSYTGIIGDLVLPSATKESSVGEFLKRKFTTDSLYSTQAIGDFYSNLKESQKKLKDAELENFVGMTIAEEQKLEREKNELLAIRKEMSSIYDQLDNTDSENEKRIRELRRKLLELAKAGNRIYDK